MTVTADISYALQPLHTNLMGQKHLSLFLLWQLSRLLPSVFLLLTPATEVHMNIFQKSLARTKGSEYIQG